MTARFIVRLLNAAGELMAWAEVFADAKPQERGASCPFWPRVPTQLPITQDGVVTMMSIHWADLDVARKTDIPPTTVSVGQIYTLSWFEPVWLVGGMRDVPLPAVTVGAPVTIGVPVGAIGVKDPRT